MDTLKKMLLPSLRRFSNRGFTLIKDFVTSMEKNDKISSNRKSYGFTLMADFFGRKRSSESKALIKDFVASIVKNDKISSKGFTLIEVLIAVSIIGLISAVALGNFRTSQIKGRDTRRKSDLAQVQKSLELYYNDYSSYPSSDGSGRILGCPATSSSPCTWGTGSFQDAGSKTTYMPVIPKDPNAQFYYFYKSSADGGKYQLFARLENTQDPTIVGGLSINCGVTCNFGLASPNVKVTDSI